LTVFRPFELTFETTPGGCFELFFTKPEISSPGRFPCNYRRKYDKIIPMSKNSTHYNFISQNTSLKLPEAILSGDRTTQLYTSSK